MTGIELLHAFSRDRSQDAFAELVRAHSSFVYSIAKRRLGQQQLAEEVTQTVFLRLATTCPRLPSEAALAGWLHRTTLHVAIDTWRSEVRRQTREQKAAAMEPSPSETPELWNEIAPHLDEALNALPEADRQALLLRFFQQKSMRETGALLGVSEDAAKMRVSRALEKLRARLPLAELALSAAALSSTLTARALEPLPDKLLAALLAPAFFQLAVPTATTASAFLPMLLLMKTKIALALLTVAALSVALYYTYDSDGRPANSPQHEAALTGSLSAPAASAPPTAHLASPGALPAAISPSALDLEDAKRALYELLQNPPYGKGYPPSELTTLLTRFDGHHQEAMPILCEAAQRSDHETRAWAVSGINFLLLRARQSSVGLYDELLAEARPVLGPILRSDTTPYLLRSMALSAYLPPPVSVIGAAPAPGGTISPEAAEDILAALRVTGTDVRSGGFAFTVIDFLSNFFRHTPAGLDHFAPAMRQLLADPNTQQRLVAAFALASWPGPKPPELKGLLLAEIKARSTHSFRAAAALGHLGPAAADTVPQLLEYAKATEGLASGGYTEAALIAACRLQPDLREQYPVIDAKLKEEEAILAGNAAPPQAEALDPAKLPAKLAHPESGPLFLESLLSSAEHHPETHAPHLLELFQTAAAHATPEQLPSVQSAITNLKARAKSPKKSPPERPPLSLINIMLEARILLTDNPNPNERKIESALDQFHNIREQKVTAENFVQISTALKQIDPGFHQEWQTQVMKTYPWLDRLLVSTNN